MWPPRRLGSILLQRMCTTRKRRMYALYFFSLFCLAGENECYMVQRDGCPKVINIGAARADWFYEKKKYGFQQK